MTTEATQLSRPAALAYSADNCSVARTLAVLGEKWTFVVIREVFNGLRRFEHMRERTGIPKQVLTDRLNVLVDQGILTKEPLHLPGERTRHEYKMTEKGFAIYPILVSMADWGDCYLIGDEGTASHFTHRDCGGHVHAELVCEHGHSLESKRDVIPMPGPGATLRDQS